MASQSDTPFGRCGRTLGCGKGNMSHPPPHDSPLAVCHVSAATLSPAYRWRGCQYTRGLGLRQDVCGAFRCRAVVCRCVLYWVFVFGRRLCLWCGLDARFRPGWNAAPGGVRCTSEPCCRLQHVCGRSACLRALVAFGRRSSHSLGGEGSHQRVPLGSAASPQGFGVVLSVFGHEPS